MVSKTKNNKTIERAVMTRSLQERECNNMLSLKRNIQNDTGRIRTYAGEAQ